MTRKIVECGSEECKQECSVFFEHCRAKRKRIRKDTWYFRRGERLLSLLKAAYG